ncbi:Hypothetical predicted protein, partial [Paramuricea clavata]
RCEKFSVVTAPDHENVIRGKRGSHQKLAWNFICFGALHSKTVRCKRNNSEEITDRDGYYDVTRNRSSKTNEVALGITITIFNFSRSENITCTTDAEGSPSATLNLVVEEGRCEKFSVVTVPDHENVIRGKRGSHQKLAWNFICFGALHSKTVRCKRNNSEEITDRDGYYDVTRNRSGKTNEVALGITITIFNFSRSENITCTTDAEGSPSATLNLVVEEDVDVGQFQNDEEEKNSSFFKEKGIWIVVGCSLLLSFVAVLLLLWYRMKLERKMKIFYRRKEK